MVEPHPVLVRPSFILPGDVVKLLYSLDDLDILVYPNTVSYDRVLESINSEVVYAMLNNFRNDDKRATEYLNEVLPPYFKGIVDAMKVRAKIAPYRNTVKGLVSVYEIYRKYIQYAWSRYTKNYMKRGSWDEFVQTYNERMIELNQILYEFQQQQMQCQMCYNKAKFKCGSCKKAVYCSEACQREDWETTHKEDCN